MDTKDDKRTISVSGEGIVRAEPDQATVRFGIVSRAEDPEEARRLNAAAAREAMNAVRERWLSSVPGDFSNAEAAIRFYDQSYQDLKEYVGHYLETTTAGLTAEEMDQEMQRLNADRTIRDKVVRVLGNLETNRYSQNGAAPSPDDARSTAQEIREIFAGSKR